MMENYSDIIRVNEEPSDTCPNAGDDHDFDSVNSYEAEEFELKLPRYEISANHINEVMPSQDRFDKKIHTGSECKYIEPKPTSISRTICKTKYQNCLPVVELGNENPNDHTKAKTLIILIQKGFN
ncbi:uncharacterized protein LOC106648485 [Trichogramma pretiosum]|uniref:uncharacterized protein LOC106648485 n=1 Tax=Trichogramma pretiosum TaxID=7493 RepID=UPI0006C96ED5|nr:uncharacterized protein LOC106648485 [Trichogramma pretiosum]